MTHELLMDDASLSSVDRHSHADVVTAHGPLDEDTFRAFYDRTSRAVWVYLARVTGDRELADDLLQEVFYRFYRANATHENEAHRRKMRHGGIAPVPIDLDDEDAALRVDSRVAERFEASTDLARAMAQLKPLQREMLWLAYALGSSHAEIAEMLGVKSGSVKILLLRARRKLAALLGPPAAKEKK